MEEHKDKIEEILSYGFRGWKDRQLPREVYEFYNIRCEVSDNGEPSKFFAPHVNLEGDVVGFRVRRLGVSKKESFYTVGSVTPFLGFENFPSGGRKLVITEGVEDMLALQQVNKRVYGKAYPVISLRSSVLDSESLVEYRDKLRAFDEVAIWTDNDEAGDKAAEILGRVIGFDKARRVKSAEKDAFERYQNTKKIKEVLTPVFDSQPMSPAGIVQGEQTWEAFKESKEMEFVPWPPFLGKLNEATYGRAMGSISVFAAGCHAKGTKILMVDGTLKNIEDIEPGMQLAGPDGSARNVKGIARGRQMMYRVKGTQGYYFDVNEDHVLSLVYCKKDTKYKGIKKGDVVNVTVKEYLTWNKTRKHSFKQYLGCGVEGKELEVPIEPWLLGMWLGDGTEKTGIISCAEPLLINELRGICESYGWRMNDSDRIRPGRHWRIVGGFQQILRREGLLGNKHIPDYFFGADRRTRMQLLAGLVDSDGYLSQNGLYEITQSRRHLAEQILRLLRGLGIRANLKTKYSKQWKRDYYRVCFYGNELRELPVVSRRKSMFSIDYKPNCSSRNIGLVSVEPLGVDNYYGVHLDGDHLYQLGNGIVTHNTGVGKTSVLREDLYHLLMNTDKKIGACFLEDSVGETVGGLIGLHLNKRVGLPSVEVSEEEERAAWEETLGSGRVLMLDHQGSVQDDSLIDKIEYMALSGCEMIYLDHITIAVSESGDNVNASIDKFMSDILKLVKRHNIWIGVVSHLRKTKAGDESFESGGQITEDDLKGSGSLKQVSFQTIALSRNKSAEDEASRNKTQLWLLKDRKTGASGPAGSYRYDAKTGRLSEAAKDEELPVEQQMGV